MENFHYWTIFFFSIEISDFKIIESRFMGLEDSSQNGAQPLQVEIH